MSASNGGGSNPDLEALQSACTEAKGTLDHQLKWIKQIDQKAVRILRANILLVGLILTAISLSVRADHVTASHFLNLYSIFGGIALIGSAIAAAVTYLASSFEAGMGHKDLEEALQEQYENEGLYEQLALGYAGWIEYNNYIIGFNAGLITITIIMVVDALALLTSGAVVGILEMGFTQGSAILFGFLIILLGLIDYSIYKAEDFFVWFFRKR